MRHLLAASAIVLAAFALALQGPFAEAKRDPEAAANAKLEKDAAKAVKGITKAAAKRIRAAAVAATKQVNLLTKAAKTGRNVEELSGVPSSPGKGPEISREQLGGLFGNYFDVLAGFHDAALAEIRTAYGQVAADPSLAALDNSTLPTRLFAAGGPLDTIPQGLADAWGDANASVAKASAKFQVTLRDKGFVFTLVDCVPPKLSAPTIGSGSVDPTGTPQIIVTCSDSDGTVGALVTRAAGAGVGGIDESNIEVSVVRDGQTAPFPTFTTYNNLVFYRHIDASLATGDHLVAAVDLRTGTFLPVTPAPLTVVGRTPTPAEAELRPALFFVTGDATGSGNSSFYALETGGTRVNSNPAIAEKAVETIVDQIFGAAAALAGAFPQAPKIGRLDADRFPCGAGPNGFTVCPSLSAPDPGGDLIAVAIAYAADIPLNDPVNLYQYGFVFDQDGVAGNNYVPIPQFANDYYRDTDKWYSAEYSPSNGWDLKVTDARNNSFVAVASAARVVIIGNVMVLAVPASEFAVTSPAYRTTSFRHAGDFGQNPPFNWSGDYDPPPGSALRPFQTE